MKKQTKTILWIIGILIVLLIGNFFLKSLFEDSEPMMGRESTDLLERANDYCEVQTINGTAVCLPEGVCEFKENREGRKICVG